MTLLKVKELEDLVLLMANILALDQATRVSGYAIFSDDKLLDYGKIVTDNPNIGIRLMEIRK
jgi:hypothetical protein